MACSRGGEVTSNKRGGVFDPVVHPTRADVSFVWAPDGTLEEVIMQTVNCKARGVEARRKLPRHLPARGSYLSPDYISSIGALRIGRRGGELSRKCPPPHSRIPSNSEHRKDEGKVEFTGQVN